jgi:hypothetical protein
MATKLGVMNAALGYLGMRILTSAQVTTPNDEPSRILTEAYDGVLLYCLEQGQWRFASKIAALAVSGTEIPTIGYNNAFAKPANYVRLNRIYGDNNFTIPLTFYDERAGFWYADESAIWIDFVSSEATLLGGYLAGWPQTYAEYVSLYLAYRVARRLQPDKEDDVQEKMIQARLISLAKDAALGNIAFTPGIQQNERKNREGE